MNAIVIGEFSAIRYATQAAGKLRACCVPGEHIRTRLLRTSLTHRVMRRAPLGSRISGIGDTERRGPARCDGMIVVVETPNHVSRALAINVLRAYGAHVVKHAVAEPPPRTGLTPSDSVILPRFTARKSKVGKTRRVRKAVIARADVSTPIYGRL